MRNWLHRLIGKHGPLVRGVVFATGWILIARYLIWRFTSTLPQQDVALPDVAALGLLSLEAVVFVVVAVNQWASNVKLTDRSAEVDTNLEWYGARPPLVDVFIPTYDESLAVLERTVVAAEGLDHPRCRIWLLDDGARPWLADFAKRRSIGYLARTGREGYKAGNLNHAFEHVTRLSEAPEFVAVLDADFVVRPGFVSRTLALMHDQGVALVQTPQEFWNPDPFQYAFATRCDFPDDLRSAYRVRLRGLDGRGGTNCCGSSFLVRARHLAAIGGLPSESITEDLLTSMRLRKAGFRCVYLDEPLSVGLAAEDLGQYLVQRARWAAGLIQAGTSACGPAHGRAWPFAAFYHITFTLKRLLLSVLPHAYLWTPIVTWWLGPVLVDAPTQQAVYYVAPILLHRGIVSMLERGSSLPMFNDGMALVASWGVIPASIRALCRPRAQKFVVTQKNMQRGGFAIYWGPFSYLSLVLGLNLLAIAFDSPSAAATAQEILWVPMWCAYNSIIVAFSLGPCVERPKYRRVERFPVTEEVRVHAGGTAHAARLRDISEGGCEIEADIRLGQGEPIELELDDGLRLQAKVVREGAGARYGLEFMLSDEHRHRVIRRIYCSQRYIRVPLAWSWFGALRAVARGSVVRVLELRRPSTVAQERRQHRAAA